MAVETLGNDAKKREKEQNEGKQAKKAEIGEK